MSYSKYSGIGGSGGGAGITDLTGDVTATGPGSAAATVDFVGGETAADVATSVQDTQAATDLSTPSTLVKRDAGGETSLDGLNLDGLTSGAINIKAADTTTNYTVKMPAAQGAASSVLENDGSGNLSWSVLPAPVTSVGGTTPIASSGGTTPTISISQAGVATDGYLSSADWNTFNNKQPSGTYVTSVGATSPVASSGGTTPTISMPQSSALSDGYLSSADWSTFNSKQNALSFGNLSEITSSVLTITGGTGAVIGSGTTIQVAQSSAVSNGYLSSGDWSTFNAKMTNPMTNAGEIIYGGVAGAPQALAAGTSEYVLVSNATTVEWRILGTGSTGAAYPTNSIIVGKVKPAGFTSQQSIILGTGTTGNVSTGTNTILIGHNVAPALATGAGSIAIGSNSVIGAAISNAIAIGTSADCSGATSMAIGASAATGTGADNIVIGNGAGRSASTGADNTIIGRQAGDALTSGNNLVLIGKNAGGAITTSNNSVVIGNGAGAAVAAGGDLNVYIGNNAGAVCTTASNCFVGHGAGGSVTNASWQTAVGYLALGFSTTGNGNTALGFSAIRFPQSTNNTALGFNALRGVPGTPSASCSENTAVGYQAITAVTTGSNNTALGSGSGGAITTGSTNIFLGFTAGDAVTTGSNNTIIGDIAGTTALASTVIMAAGTAERFRIDSNGNMGLGTAAPNVRLDVQNTTAATNTVTNILRLDSQSSGTPAAGIGSGIEMAAETAAGNTEVGVVLEAVTNDVTAASEDFDFVVKTMTAGAAATEKLKVGSNGSTTVANGDLILNTAGNGINIKEGTNARLGITGAFPATNPNTVTVSTTEVTANSRIFLSAQSNPGGHQPDFWISTVTANTSFVITSHDNNFTGTVAWMIVEPA